jgi:hypothetical protein
MRKQPAILGLLGVALLWSFQFLTVHYNYGGNWTALFRIGPQMPVPDFLKSENLYIFQGTQGYDGQVYHLIAHDPWMSKGSAAAITGAAFRYQRILVPALAWTVALGQDRWIHPAYFAVILVFAFLGVYWLGLFSTRLGHSPAWGLVFTVTPATIVSLERMTVDIALAAFTAGIIFYIGEPPASRPSGKGPGWRIAILLTGAALTRETALPIIAGYSLYLFSRKQIQSAILTAATALPAVAWFVYLVRIEPSAVSSYINWIPLSGFVERVSHPPVYAGPAWKAAIGMTCDYLALAAIAVALILAARLALLRMWNAPTAVLYCLAIAAIFIGSRGVWEEAEAFGRVLTPLLLLTAVPYFSQRSWIAFAPMLLVDAPIALTLWQQIAGIARGLLS